MSAAVIDAGDVLATARFVHATIAHIASLRRGQRHEAAERSLCGLRRLARTIEAQAAIHGYMPTILFGDLFAAIEADQ
jgi:hypothetical protein